MSDEESIQSVWSRLSLFLSRDILERRYSLIHRRDLSAAKANEIISHLEQAREYFESAASSGVLVRPLLQYYGVLAFARAIILFLIPTARESTLTKAHGLSTNLDGSSNIEDMRITMHRGTFSELLEATRNGQLSTVQIFKDEVFSDVVSAVRVVTPLPRPSVGSSFSLTELLARIPHLMAQFESALDHRSNCHKGFATGINSGSAVSVNLQPLKSEVPSASHLRDSLGIPSDATIRVSEVGLFFCIEFQFSGVDGSPAFSLLPCMHDRRGGHIFVERFAHGWSLSNLASYFVGSHVLSTLVRYHATQWSRLINHEKGDRSLPVLERLRDLIQVEFVKLILKELNGHSLEDGN